MNRYLNAAMAAVLLATACPAVGEEEQGGAGFTPVEIFTCKFNERKSFRDLEKVIAEFNTWADARPVHRYSAVTLTPWYFNSDIDFDFIWLGWWPDGATMGASNDDWIANGGAFMAKYAEISPCDQHLNFAALALKAPTEQNVPADGVLSFSDCSLKDDAEIGEALAALSEWGEYEKSQGNHSALWAYFPVFGAGKVDYAFKLVESFKTRKMMGEIYDWWGTGGAYQKAEELYGNLLQCDSPRLYNFTLRRDMNK